MTMTDLLSEMKLLRLCEEMRAAAEAAGAEAVSVHLRLAPYRVEGLEGIKGELKMDSLAPRIDFFGLCSLGQGTSGRVLVTVHASRPATREDVLRLLPDLAPEMRPAVPPAREVRVCDATAGQALAEVPRG